MNRIIKISSLLILILVSVSCSQDGNPSKAISERVKALEGQNEIFKEKINLLSEKINNDFEVKSNNLDLKTSQIENKLTNEYNYLKFFTLIFGTLTIGGLIISVFAFYRKFYKVASQKIEEKFETFFNENKEKIIRLIELQDEELQLKKNKSILVLSGADSDDSFMKSFFEEMGFKKIVFEQIQHAEDMIDVDLILFNNEDSKMDGNLILDCALKSSKNTICFYFGSSRFEFGPDMNALRYQGLLI